MVIVDLDSENGMSRGCAKTWDARDESFGSSCATCPMAVRKVFPPGGRRVPMGPTTGASSNLSSLIASTGKKAALLDLRNMQSSVPFP